VGPRAGVDRYGKSRPPPGFDPGPSSPVAQSLYRLSYRTHIRFQIQLPISRLVSVVGREETNIFALLQFMCGREGRRHFVGLLLPNKSVEL